MRNIYCIVGPSGSGKTSVANALREEYGYGVVESYTTRPPRHAGEEGYQFVSAAEFHSLGRMYAYTKFDGYEYGVTAEELAEKDLYILDPAGVKALQEEYRGEKVVRVIGLTAPVDVLRRRMKQRGDTEEKVSRRLANDALVFWNLSSQTDICINAEGSVADICECIHEFIDYHERHAAYWHEFALYNERNLVVSSGKQFHSAEDAEYALKKAYPDGLPDGWYIRDETLFRKDQYVRAIKECNPAFKLTGIEVNMDLVQCTSSDGGYVAVPFMYHEKWYIYREHLCTGWIEPWKAPAEMLGVDALIQKATEAASGKEQPKRIDEKELML